MSWSNFTKSLHENLTATVKKIDTLLDIKEENDESSSIADESAVRPDATSTGDNSITDTNCADNKWLDEMNFGPVVDAEPNPIRDTNDLPRRFEPILTDESHSDPLSEAQGSPSFSSPSPSNAEQFAPTDQSTNANTSIMDSGDYAETVQDVNLNIEGGSSSVPPIIDTINGPPPMIGSYHLENKHRRHSDENLTVASSDIEVVRNIDAWSINSRMTSENGKPSKTKSYVNDHILEKRIEELKALSVTQADEIRMLQLQNTTLCNERLSLSKQLSICEQEKKDLITQGMSFSKEISNLRQELRRVKAKLETTEARATSLASDSRKLREKLDSALDEKDSDYSLLESQQAELVDVKNRLDAALGKLAEKESEVSHIEKESERKFNEELIIASKEIALREDQLHNTKLELERVKASVVAVAAERDEFRTRFELLRDELSKKENEIQSFGHSVDSAKMLVLEDLYEQQQRTIDELTKKNYSQKAQYEREIEHLTSETQAKEHKISDLVADLTIARERNEQQLLQDRSCDRCAELEKSEEFLRQHSEGLSSQISQLLRNVEDEQKAKHRLLNRALELTIELKRLKADEQAIARERSVETRKPNSGTCEKCVKRENEYDALLCHNGELIEREKELLEDISDLKQAIQNLSIRKVEQQSNQKHV